MMRSPDLKLLFVLLLLTAGAMAFRAPCLTIRPFHGDEAIHAVKYHEMCETGAFTYDPNEYHGPTLHYLTAPVMWLTDRNYMDATEAYYRIVPAIFGSLLILALWLLRREMGFWETVWAGLLTAVSSAMVFYSRYYIQEMILVFFTFLALASLCRYARSRRIGWAILFGVSVGMMHATKETWVIAAAALAGAGVATGLWVRLIDRQHGAARGLFRWGAVVVAILAMVLIASLFLSGFFVEAAKAPTVKEKLLTALKGPWDSVLAYRMYLDRGTGNSDHDHPWNWYLRLLAWAQYGRLWFSEGLIFALAAAGAAVALCTRPRLTPSSGSVAKPILAMSQEESAQLIAGALTGAFSTQRIATDVPALELAPSTTTAQPPAVDVIRRRFRLFLLFYVVILTAAYSAIPYKTPWCMLSFLHAMILLGGIGAAALVRMMSRLVPQIIMSLLLLAAGGYFGWQLVHANGVLYCVLISLATVVLAGAIWLARRRLPAALMALVLLAATAHLGWQAYRLSFPFQQGTRKMAMFCDPRNPYVYSHPGLKMYELVERVENLAKAHPDGRQMRINVFTKDIWPIPWYLRAYPNIWFWPDVETAIRQGAAAGIGAQAVVNGPVVIASSELDSAVAEHLTGGYAPADFFGLRPHVLLIMHVQNTLWNQYLAPAKAPAR